MKRYFALALAAAAGGFAAMAVSGLYAATVKTDLRRHGN